MNKTLAILIGLLGIAIAGCHEGDNGNMTASDMSMMAAVHDLSMPDLAQKSCGAIVLCAIQSGTTNPLGALQCFTGGSTDADSQATALIGCAAQNCLTSGDGGIGSGLGDPVALLQCLNTSCQMQLGACQGLSL